MYEPTGGAIAPHHNEMLAASGITDEHAAARVGDARHD